MSTVAAAPATYQDVTTEWLARVCWLVLHARYGSQLLLRAVNELCDLEEEGHIRPRERGMAPDEQPGLGLPEACRGS
jgi:hypothetical protein